jgi:hypothetical protein
MAADLTQLLKEMREQCEKCTSGPWYVVVIPSERPEECGISMRTDPDDKGTDLFDTFNRGYKVSLVEQETDSARPRWYDRAGKPDMDFIARSRTLVPALISVVEVAVDAIRQHECRECMDALSQITTLLKEARKG